MLTRDEYPNNYLKVFFLILSVLYINKYIKHIHEYKCIFIDPREGIDTIDSWYLNVLKKKTNKYYS